MKKPTSSTVTPSSSDWASDGVVVYLVGLAVGVREGLVPNFGTLQLFLLVKSNLMTLIV